MNDSVREAIFVNVDHSISDLMYRRGIKYLPILPDLVAMARWIFIENDESTSTCFVLKVNSFIKIESG